MNIDDIKYYEIRFEDSDGVIEDQPHYVMSYEYNKQQLFNFYETDRDGYFTEMREISYKMASSKYKKENWMIDKNSMKQGDFNSKFKELNKILKMDSIGNIKKFKRFMKE